MRCDLCLCLAVYVCSCCRKAVCVRHNHFVVVPLDTRVWRHLCATCVVREARAALAKQV